MTNNIFSKLGSNQLSVASPTTLLKKDLIAVTPPKFLSYARRYENLFMATLRCFGLSFGHRYRFLNVINSIYVRDVRKKVEGRVST